MGLEHLQRYCTSGGWKSAVERGQILDAQAQVERSAIVADMIGRSGFRNSDDAVVAKHPRQSYLGRGCTVLVCDSAHLSPL